MAILQRELSHYNYFNIPDVPTFTCFSLSLFLNMDERGRGMMRMIQLLMKAQLHYNQVEYRRGSSGLGCGNTISVSHIHDYTCSAHSLSVNIISSQGASAGFGKEGSPKIRLAGFLSTLL